MNIEITLHNAHLKAENLQSNHMTDAIQGFFYVLNAGFNKESKQLTTAVQVEKSTPVSTTPKESIEKVKPATVQTKLDVDTSTIKKVLPKIDDHRSLNVSVAERVEAQQEQKHWETGIKVDEDGTERYRCYYWCDCGSKGKRYIHEYDEIVACRECGQEIYVEAATPNYQKNGLPERDKFGNFFIAREVATISD